MQCNPIATVDRSTLARRAGMLPPWLLESVLDGVEIVLGRRERR